MPLSLPCDACSFRRVKCDGLNPCSTCLRRQQPCTYLKVRKRRGPKGPRKSTSARVQAMQRNLGLEKSCSMRESSRCSVSGSDETVGSTPGSDLSTCVGVMSVRRIPMSAYYTYIDIFRSQLYALWPVVETNELKAGLGDGSGDGCALAAALCAATLVQLRLPGNAQASEFLRECLQLRSETEYHSTASLDSLLTSFFLHLYYANTDQDTLATFALRDAITHAHILNLSCSEDQLSLRVYWTLFIAERMFCLQHDLPMTVRTIDNIPAAIDDASTGLCHYIHLYTRVDHLFHRPYHVTVYSQTDIESIQETLQLDLKNTANDEVQQMEIWITTAWLSCLVWQYSASHFMLSSESELCPSLYFCPSYPFIVASKLLSCVYRASIDSIRPLGSGVETKLFQLATSLVDVLKYVPSLAELYDECDRAPRHAVLALEHLLEMISGGRSPRLEMLRTRMAEVNLTSSWRSSSTESDEGFHEVKSEYQWSGVKIQPSLDCDGDHDGILYGSPAYGFSLSHIL